MKKLMLGIIGAMAVSVMAVELDPSDPLNDFRITRFWMDGDMPMFEFNHTTDGSGNSILPYVRPLGKANLKDAWLHVPDGGNPAFRFFAAEVVLPGCESAVDDGVQLWKNGPYWATRNVGASKPEEYGYYFWWGDVVGYTQSEGKWVSSTDEQTGTRPFASCPTYDKNNSALLAAGYIDSTTNLVAAFDAATVHLSTPWRMPTREEMEALLSNCTTTWITTNGVNGCLVTGKDDYADRSIFLPAAGHGDDLNLDNPGSGGYYWSSTPSSDNQHNAWGLYFDSGDFSRRSVGRSNGRTIRPVRGFVQ